MDGPTDGRTDAPTDEQTNVRTDNWMDGSVQSPLAVGMLVVFGGVAGDGIVGVFVDGLVGVLVVTGACVITSVHRHFCVLLHC